MKPVSCRAAAAATIVPRLPRLCSSCRQMRCRRCWDFQAIAITAGVLVLLAALKDGPEPGRSAVVPGRLGEQPPGVTAAGPGQLPLAAGLPRAALRWYEPEVAHQLPRPLEAMKSPISAQSPTAVRVSIPRRH